MLSTDAKANPKQANITEDITRKRRLKRHQFINHNQNHKPDSTSVDHLLITCRKKCYLNNYLEKCRRCTLKAVCSVSLIFFTLRTTWLLYTS